MEIRVRGRGLSAQSPFERLCRMGSLDLPCAVLVLVAPVLRVFIAGFLHHEARQQQKASPAAHPTHQE